jgi:2'-hydroxyisoflavone reductase
MVKPPGTYSMGRFMTDCKAVAGSDVRLTWVDLAFIEKHGLYSGGELPIWAPMSGDNRSDALVNGDRSFAKGMRTRPERETIRDILQWWPTLPEDRRNNMRAGLSPEREAQMLVAWHEQNA